MVKYNSREVSINREESPMLLNSIFKQTVSALEVVGRCFAFPFGMAGSAITALNPISAPGDYGVDDYYVSAGVSDEDVTMYNTEPVE